MGLRPEQLLDRRPHQRNACRAAYHHNLVDVFDRHACILNAFAARAKRPVHNGRDQLIEQFTVDLALIFLAPVLEFDIRERGERELLFGLDHRAPEPLHALAVRR